MSSRPAQYGPAGDPHILLSKAEGESGISVTRLAIEGQTVCEMGLSCFGCRKHRSGRGWVVANNERPSHRSLQREHHG
jgi:hypothetical protein